MAVGSLSITRRFRLPLLIAVVVTLFIYAICSTTSMVVPRQPIAMEVAGVLERRQHLLNPLPLTKYLNSSNQLRQSVDLKYELSRQLQSFFNAKQNSSLEDYRLDNTLQNNISTDLTTEVDSQERSSPEIAIKVRQVNPSIETERLYESLDLNDDINIDRICQLNGLNTKLLILILSAVTHVAQRNSIRQTWGQYGARRDVGIAFVVGRTFNKTKNEALSEESYLNGDIIRGNNFDTYENLTLKVVSALEWADQRCHRAKYILKADDDTFINTPKLLNFINDLEKRQVKRAIFGRLAKYWKPDRNINSKHYITVNQCPERVYPFFTTGPAYLMTGDIVHDLYLRSLKTVFLKLEDIFITGIVAKSLGIRLYHVKEFINVRAVLTCKIQKSISVHMIRPHEQFDMWHKIHNWLISCSISTPV